LITILRRGGAILPGPVSLKSCITTVPQACRATSSHGLQAPGESRNSQRASFNSANAGTALEDVVVGGMTIKKGEHILCLIGAGNRDPDVYPNPDRLDITRKGIRPFSF
jgi:hypothetical protein